MAEDIRNRTDVEQVKFAPHEAIEWEEVPFKYYHSAQSYMKFINKDGTEMQFRHHFLATNNSAHQDYLDEEIQRHGNTQLSYASQEEIERYKFAQDPKGTIIEQIKEDPDAMAELKWEIENKVRRENGLEELPPLAGMKTREELDLEKLKGVSQGKGTEVKTPTGKVTLEDLKDKTQASDGVSGPGRLNVASTNSLPGAHTPNPGEVAEKK